MSFGTWIALGAAITVAVLIVSAAHWMLSHQLSKVWRVAPPLVRRCRYSAYAAAMVVAVNLAMPGGEAVEDRPWYGTFEHGMWIAMIGSLTWLALSVAFAMTDAVMERLQINDEDTDRKSRRVRTQIRVLRRVLATIIIIIALSAALWTFPAVQALGAGLLGTAGLVGIVAGVAAQTTLGNVFAGLQLAFGDSLRINDVVVVEGEWGRVEELSLTHVVVRIWDERRLILPVSYFTSNPFENWTKHGATVTGKVYMRVDWHVSIPRLREEIGTYIANHPLWDGRRWSLQATDILESGVVELRVVVTAADSDAQWDLCCDVREHLLQHIVENYPEALPRRRTEFSTANGDDSYAARFPSSAFRRSSGGRERPDEVGAN